MVKNTETYTKSEKISDMMFYSFLNKIDSNEGIDKKIFETLLQEIKGSKYETYIEESLMHWGYFFREESRLDHNRFKAHLEYDYGLGFYYMELIFQLSCELGELMMENNNDKKNSLEYLSVMMHKRACSLFGEIIHLLKGGYGTGALTRLRSLYETTITYEFLLKNGEEACQSFIAYEEVVKIKDLIFLKSLYGKNIADEVLIKNYKENDQSKLIEKYGEEFANIRGNEDYIWAKPYLKKNFGNKRTSFNAIVREVGRKHGREQFKLASHNIHAGPRLMSASLNSLTRFPEVGASNIGLTTPAQWSIFEIYLINLLLLNLIEKVDNNHSDSVEEKEVIFDSTKAQFIVRLIQTLIDKAYVEFITVENNIREEEERLKEEGRQ